MNHSNEFAKMMAKRGYLTTQDAAKATGRTHGGNIPALFERHGVRKIEMPMSAGGKMHVFYLAEDVAKVPKKTTRRVPLHTDLPGLASPQIVESKAVYQFAEQLKAAFEEAIASFLAGLKQP